MPEKRNIYYLQLVVLKYGGIYSPFTSADPLYKRILYKVWTCYAFFFSGFWELCLILLFVYDTKTTGMNELTMAMSFLVQVVLGNVKTSIAMIKRKDIEWLAEQTEVEPFYREHDEEFKKNLRISVAISTSLTRLFWILVIFTLTIPAINGIIFTLNNFYTMKHNCNKKVNIYQEKFNELNATMPEILGNPKIYEQVDLIEDYIKNNKIFEIDTKIECAVPLKILSFGAHTPYDHQKYFVISFVSQFTSFWFYGTQNMPLDLMIMSTMIQLRFQFHCLIKDLLSMRKDCIEIIKKRPGSSESSGEHIDEKILVKEIKNRLKTIILHHEHILRYYNTAEEVYTWMLFAQCFGTSVMMCGMMYELAFSDFKSLGFLQMCTFMIGIMFQLFINCHYGNDLIVESQLVANAAYNCGWEKSGEYSYQLKPYLSMIMCRSSRVTSFSAGKFALISLETFVGIAKTSYSYYTVMSTSSKGQ